MSNKEEAEGLARRANDYMAGQFHTPFWAFIIKQAATSLHRAVKELGLVGAIVLSW